MRYYANKLTQEVFIDVLKFFFKECDKVNIYFPNELSPSSVKEFHDDFLAAAKLTNIEGVEDDLLTEKDGYSMIIASLTDDIKNLLITSYPKVNLSMGLINKEDKVIFYVGDEGEFVIETDGDSNFIYEDLFKGFKII